MAHYRNFTVSFDFPASRWFRENSECSVGKNPQVLSSLLSFRRTTLLSVFETWIVASSNIWYCNFIYIRRMVWPAEILFSNILRCVSFAVVFGLFIAILWAIVIFGVLWGGLGTIANDQATPIFCAMSKHLMVRRMGPIWLCQFKVRSCTPSSPLPPPPPPVLFSVSRLSEFKNPQ